MTGYLNDYSMSRNAAAAYRDNEMPLSKWTKTEILSECGEKAEMLKLLHLPELRLHLLRNTGYHHTSAMYNRTEFYAIDDNALDEMTPDRVAEIISRRKPKCKKQCSEKDEPQAAEITYTVWEGKYRNYRKPHQYTETVMLHKNDKMVQTVHGGRKRVSCLDRLKWLGETSA